MARSYLVGRADGSVWVLHVHDDKSTPEQEIAKWSADDQQAVVSIVTMSDAPPSDRSYRNGWTLEGSKVVHDMTKCRDIHRDKLRAARAPLLAALDIEYQRADETRDNARKQQIVAEKEALRDVTADPRIDAAKTVDELKAVWPL